MPRGVALSFYIWAGYEMSVLGWDDLIQIGFGLGHERCCINGENHTLKLGEEILGYIMFGNC